MCTIVNNENLPSIVDFPSECDNGCNARIYDNTSLENHIAVLSHYLHSPCALSHEQRLELLKDILTFISNKPEINMPLSDFTEEYLTNLLKEPARYNLFSDFFDVPFPNPDKSEFTFIDLFAGIGGIRLPFTELGYKCVFSSEWDKYAQKTYLANFGEMPFGDICRSSTKSFIPDSFDLLLAGFPCQAFLLWATEGDLKTQGELCSLKLPLSCDSIDRKLFCWKM